MTFTTGLPGFDAALGNLPKGTRVLLECTPGVDATPLLNHMATDSGPIIYLSLVRNPIRVRTEIPRAVIIDGYSGLFGGVAPDVISVQPADDPQELISCLRQARKLHPDAPLIVEGLAAVSDRSPAGLAAMRAILDEARDFPWSLVQGIIWGPGEARDLLHQSSSIRFHLETNLTQLLSRPRLSLEFDEQTVGPTDIELTTPPVVSVPKIVIFGEGAEEWVAQTGGKIMAGVPGSQADVAGAGYRTRVVALPSEPRFAPLLPSLAAGAVVGLVLGDATPPDLGIPWEKDEKFNPKKTGTSGNRQVQKSLATLVDQVVQRGWA